MFKIGDVVEVTNSGVSSVIGKSGIIINITSSDNYVIEFFEQLPNICFDSNSDHAQPEMLNVGKPKHCRTFKLDYIKIHKINLKGQIISKITNNIYSINNYNEILYIKFTKTKNININDIIDIDVYKKGNGYIEVDNNDS